MLTAKGSKIRGVFDQELVLVGGGLLQVALHQLLHAQDFLDLGLDPLALGKQLLQDGVSQFVGDEQALLVGFVVVEGQAVDDEVVSEIRLLPGLVLGHGECGQVKEAAHAQDIEEGQDLTQERHGDTVWLWRRQASRLTADSCH